MQKRLTTTTGKTVQHPLALAVYNDSSHYNDRVRLCEARTNRDYRAYLLKLVNIQVASERREHGTRYKQSDVDTSVSELHKAMSEHVQELFMQAAALPHTPEPSAETEGIKAIIYLQSIAGIVETPEQAKNGWGSMRAHERDTTLRLYRQFCAG